VNVDPSLIVGVVITLVTAAIGFLLGRMIDGVDKKIDALATSHTNALVAFADLKAHVAGLEHRIERLEGERS
jgi:ABC-type dipeptide/oligopeptide/nickel transport system permease subunit